MKNIFRNRDLFYHSILPGCPKLLSLSIITILFIVFNTGISGSYAQTTVFSDNFESGTSNWTLQGTWELTTSISYSPNNSLTTANSSGTYLANQNISATMAHGVDLSSYKGAEIDFYGQYVLEQGFDYGYLEVSKDNGNSWFKIDSLNGTLSSWTLFKYDITSFAGNSNVIARFRLLSDQYVQYAGMYIDDFKIIGLPTDVSPPFIAVQSPPFYQGNQGNETVNAQIFDPSGVQSTTLYYKVGAAGPFTLSPSSIVGNNYTFIIPAQSPGALVYYKIGAVDSSIAHNVSDTSKATANYYISGTYLSYDNGAVDGVTQFTSSGSTTGAAVKISAPTGGTFKLVTALIRNYTDPNFLNNQMLFHVWADDGTGKPGTDLITPFLVTPAATLLNPYPMTVVDLSSFAAQLSSLSGNFFVGFTVPSGSVNIINSSAASGQKSFNYSGTAWSSVTNVDYEFRAVINDNGTLLPVELNLFTAVSNSRVIQLNWKTQTEKNSDKFEIERASLGGNENLTWTNVGSVKASVLSNSPKQYSFTDKNLQSGKYQYRLKMIDNDGTFEYSKLIEAEVAIPQNFELSQNFPNPFNPSTRINYNLPFDSMVTLEVYNITGERVSQLVNEDQSAGYYSVDFGSSKLSSGIYLYRMTAADKATGNNFSEIKKMIMLK